LSELFGTRLTQIF